MAASPLEPGARKLPGRLPPHQDSPAPSTPGPHGEAGKQFTRAGTVLKYLTTGCHEIRGSGNAEHLPLGEARGSFSDEGAKLQSSERQAFRDKWSNSAPTGLMLENCQH